MGYDDLEMNLLLDISIVFVRNVHVEGGGAGGGGERSGLLFFRTGRISSSCS